MCCGLSKGKAHIRRQSDTGNAGTVYKLHLITVYLSTIGKMHDTGDQSVNFFYQYNTVTVPYKGDKITFSKISSGDNISLLISEIKEITTKPDNEDVIYIEMINGDKYVTCLFGTTPYDDTGENDSVDIEWFANNLKRSLHTVLHFGSNEFIHSRTVYDKCVVGDMDDEGKIKVELSDAEGGNTLSLTLSEDETEITLEGEGEARGVYYLQFPEMPFTTVMMVLNYQQIAMLLPVSLLDTIMSP